MHYLEVSFESALDGDIGAAGAAGAEVAGIVAEQLVADAVELELLAAAPPLYID